MSQAGLQEAHEAFSSMLTGDTPDNQQELEAKTDEVEVETEGTDTPDVETETETEEIEAEGEEEEAQEEPESQYYRVKLDGVEMEVTLDEALSGYQRQQDYTKKTQALADEKKQLQAEVESARQDRLNYQQSLEKLVQFQQSQQPKEPDWDALYEQDPLEWMKRKEDFRTQKEKNLELQQEHFRMQQQSQYEQQEQMKVHLQQEHQTLIESIPEWKDPKVMNAEKTQIRDYAVSIGYTPEEISQVYDARAVQALRHGMIASGLKGKGKVKLRPATPAIRSVTPGSETEQPKKQTSLHKSKIRLAKSGKMSDAKEVFKQML